MFIKINTLMILDLCLWAIAAYILSLFTSHHLLIWAVYALYLIVLNGVVSSSRIEGLLVAVVRTYEEDENFDEYEEEENFDE